MKRSSTLLMAVFTAFSFFGQQLSGSQHVSVQKNTFKTATLNGSPSNETKTVTFSGSGLTSCKSHDFTTQHYLERGVLEDFNSSYLHGAAHPSVPATAKTPGVNTIPIIFHVVYNPNNPAENVSNALIMQVYNDIVEDYQLLNTDAANARTGFGFNPADANINFCLATKMPNGTPLAELGVHRVSTTEDWYNSDGGEENKMKYTAQGGTDSWDRNKYLNVWICDISNGANSGVAGYAYRPTTTYLPTASIDGIVIDYNLGVNNENVLTHEIGHYLGLDHTWGGSGSCSLDDGFGDTPNTAGPSFNYPGSCSGNQSTCGGTQTQYENYMDYSNCTVMFTQNQADYMLTILTGIRNSLLLSDACDPVNAPPVANFTANIGSPIIIPVGGAVTFYDQSSNAPTGWSWNFGGGATASTLQNPTKTFSTIGTYTVTLTASNSYGSDAEVKTGYVQVVAAAAGTACDTLRNYNPVTESMTAYLAEVGYLPGTGKYSNIPMTKWADKYTAASTTHIRRLRFPIFQADDMSGNGMMKIRVKNDNAGSPGTTVMALDTFLFADMSVNQWNEFDFTTPPTVTGTFWIEFEYIYGTPLDTMVMAMVPMNRVSGINTCKVQYNNVWYTMSAFFGAGNNSSLFVDVLTSNGPDPVADLTLTDVAICQGGEISYNGSSSTNTTNYYWYQTNDPVTTIISNSNSASGTFTFANTGNHRIYLFADGSCKTDGVYVPITVVAKPSATVTKTNTTCGNNNGTITITGATGGNGTKYCSLDGVNYTTNTTYSNLAPGTYTVHVATTGDNCENTYTVTIAASTPFTASVSPNTAICQGNNASLTASGGTSYQWFNGSTSIGNTATINVSPNTTNQYTCIVTNGSGCSNTVYTTVTVNPLANATFTFNDYCLAAPNGPTNVATNGGVYSFNPAVTDGATINATTGVITNGVLGTTYTVQYAFGGACPSSSTQQVTVNAVDNANFTVSPWCGTANNAISNVVTPGGVFALNPAPSDGATINPATGVISNGVQGNSYSIQYTTPVGLCQSSATQTVSYHALPTVSAGTDQSVCQNTNVTLTGTGASTYIWNNGVSQGTPFSATATTTYTVTGTDANGCSNTDQVTVTVNPLPTVNAGADQTICLGQSVTLTATGATNLSWNNGITNGLSFTPNATANYTVTGTDGNGCSNTDMVTITVNDCADIKEILSAAIEIYPNPTNAIFTIELEGSFDFNLMDSRGRLVAEGSATNTTTISLENAEAGVYFLNVHHSNANGVYRIVKQ